MRTLRLIPHVLWTVLRDELRLYRDVLRELDHHRGR